MEPRRTQSIGTGVRVGRLRKGLSWGIVCALLAPFLLTANGLASPEASGRRARATTRVESITMDTRDGRDRIVVTLNNDKAALYVNRQLRDRKRLELRRASVSTRVPRVLSAKGADIVQSIQVRKRRGGRVSIDVTHRAGAHTTAIREGRRLVWLFSRGQGADRKPAAITVAKERLSEEELAQHRAQSQHRLPSQHHVQSQHHLNRSLRRSHGPEGTTTASATGESSWRRSSPPQGNPRASRGSGHDESTAAVPTAAGFMDGPALQVRSIGKRRRYSGRRVDLDFKDADIHNILRLIADVGKVNIITSDDVSGSVTIRMRNVPWDEALDVILQAKSLGMVRRSNLIRVAPLETLEKERESAVARRKLEQQLAPLETRLVPVSYAKAGDLNARVRDLLSGRGNVSVDERTNTLIVRDVVSTLGDIEELVRTLDTQTPQVLIEARIVEASSQYARDVGIQWGGNLTFASGTGNPTGLAFPANVSAAGGNFDANTPTQGLSPFNAAVAPSNFGVNLPAITGTGEGGALGMTFGSLNGAINLNVRLSAAESSGTVRIVSSPSILTLDNHEAHIGQGTLIPFSQVSAQGVQTAFQEAKLELRVRPHVTSDGAVTMHVKIMRDEPDFSRTGARGDPTILKREAETDLLVTDGETAVIGGIYTRNSARNKTQIPFFGDIPILGILFKRRRVSDDRNELLIFLTPRIVNRDQALKL